MLSICIHTKRSDPNECVRVLRLPPPSIVSIDPSLNCVILDLFVSLKVPFRSCLCLCVVPILFVCRCDLVRVRVGCSPFDRIYPSVSLSCRNGSFCLSLRHILVLVLVLVRVLLPPPPMTTPTNTPTPSLL